MESHGVPGRIQVTAETARRLVGAYGFERRGEIEVKGKGRMETWFLVGPRDAPTDPATLPAQPTPDTT
jgi:hypothetical protein